MPRCVVEEPPRHVHHPPARLAARPSRRPVLRLVAVPLEAWSRKSTGSAPGAERANGHAAKPTCPAQPAAGKGSFVHSCPRPARPVAQTCTRATRSVGQSASRAEDVPPDPPVQRGQGLHKRFDIRHLQYGHVGGIVDACDGEADLIAAPLAHRSHASAPGRPGRGSARPASPPTCWRQMSCTNDRRVGGSGSGPFAAERGSTVRRRRRRTSCRRRANLARPSQCTLRGGNANAPAVSHRQGQRNAARSRTVMPRKGGPREGKMARNLLSDLRPALGDKRPHNADALEDRIPCT